MGGWPPDPATTDPAPEGPDVRGSEAPSRVWSLVGLAVALALACAYLVLALGYSVGSLRHPGPGLFPSLVGAVLVIGVLVRGGAVLVGRHQSGQRHRLTRGAYLRVAAIVVAIAAYVVLIPYVTDLVAAAGLTFTVAYAMGLRRIWVAAILAVAFAVLSHVLFVMVLNVPLGEGSGLW